MGLMSFVDRYYEVGVDREESKGEQSKGEEANVLRIMENNQLLRYKDISIYQKTSWSIVSDFISRCSVSSSVAGCVVHRTTLSSGYLICRSLFVMAIRGRWTCWSSGFEVRLYLYPPRLLHLDACLPSVSLGVRGVFMIPDRFRAMTLFFLLLCFFWTSGLLLTWLCMQSYSHILVLRNVLYCRLLDTRHHTTIKIPNPSEDGLRNLRSDVNGWDDTE